MAGYDFSVTVEGADKVANALLFKSAKVASDAQKQMLTMAALMVEATAKEKAPTDKGVLRNSITHRVEGSFPNMSARVGTNIEYAVYQEYGTGIYGPKSRPITPKRAPFLVFRLKDGTLIRTRSVAGSPKKEYMKSGVAYLSANMGKVTALGRKIFESQVFG